MKLVRFGAAGREKPGVVDSEGRIRGDLSGLVPDIAGEALSAKSLAKLAKVKAEQAAAGRRHAAARALRRQHVPRSSPSASTTADHAAEAGAKPPTEPILFMKATSAINGPDDDIMIPKGSEKTDWEVELGIVIGSVTRYISSMTALDAISPAIAWSTTSPSAPSRSSAPGNGTRARAPTPSRRSGPGW